MRVRILIGPMKGRLNRESLSLTLALDVEVGSVNEGTGVNVRRRAAGDGAWSSCFAGSVAIAGAASNFISAGVAPAVGEVGGEAASVEMQKQKLERLNVE